jgi:hypothetical protein
VSETPDSAREVPDHLIDFYRHNLAGTYTSNWAFLRTAAASSFRLAAASFQNVIDAWQRGRANPRLSRAEVCSILYLNYGFFVSGPALAATLLPVFALESFLRYCAEVGLRMQSTGPDALRLALAAYDSQAFEERARSVASFSGAAPFEKELLRQLTALVSFRNAAAHDVPLYQMPSGHLVQTRRGKSSLFDESNLFEGMYPRLAESNMPLTLRHARRAVDTHDAFVQHIAQAAASDFRDEFLRLLSPEQGKDHLIKSLGGKLWNESEQLATFWQQEVFAWSATVTVDEADDYLRGLARREHVKPVRDDL